MPALASNPFAAGGGDNLTTYFISDEHRRLNELPGSNTLDFGFTDSTPDVSAFPMFVHFTKENYLQMKAVNLNNINPFATGVAYNDTDSSSDENDSVPGPPGPFTP